MADQLTPLRRAARAAHTRTLSLNTYRAHARPDDPSSRWFIRHYGSWTAATEAAGLRPAGPARDPWTEAQLLEAIAACHADIQTPLTTTRYKNWQADHPDRPPLSRLQTAGFDRLARRAKVPRTHGRDRPNRFSDDDLAAAIRRASTGKPGISAQQYNLWRDRQPDRAELPSAQAIELRAHSWPAARQSAGVAEARTDTLVALRQALAEVPNLTARTYRAWSTTHADAPSLDVQLREHGTWRQALEAATTKAPAAKR